MTSYTVNELIFTKKTLQKIVRTLIHAREHASNATRKLHYGDIPAATPFQGIVCMALKPLNSHLW